MPKEIARNFLELALIGAQEIDDPAVYWDLAEILSLASISCSSDISTLAMSYRSGQHELWLNPDFLKKFVRSPQDALFLLLHELGHKVRGDFWVDRRTLTGNCPWRKLIANLAEDMLINRSLELHYFQNGVGLLDRVYGRIEWPTLLLSSPRKIWSLLELSGRPSSGKASRKKLAKGFEKANINCGDPQKAADCYVWAMIGGVGFSELFHDLLDLLKPEPWMGSEVMFLGSHDEEGETFPIPKGLEKYIAAGRQNDEIDEIMDTQEKNVVPEMVLQAKKFNGILQAIHLALEEGTQWRRTPKAVSEERSLVFAPGRKELVLLAQGHNPVFFSRFFERDGPGEANLWFYLDASYSMEDHLPQITLLIQSLKDWIGSGPIWLFSEKVMASHLGDIAKGRFLSTGGTDFDCMVQHAREKGARRILCVTDGEADLSPSNRSWLITAGIELFLVLFGQDQYHYTGTPLFPLAKKSWLV